MNTLNRISYTYGRNRSYIRTGFLFGFLAFSAICGHYPRIFVRFDPLILLYFLSMPEEEFGIRTETLRIGGYDREHSSHPSNKMQIRQAWGSQTTSNFFRKGISKMYYICLICGKFREGDDDRILKNVCEKCEDKGYPISEEEKRCFLRC
jgi:hypothetical protein